MSKGGLRLALGIWLTVAARLWSQFYAPDTEYHDLAQRFFVVEAARVLAWRENELDLKYSKVTYDVRLDPARVISWHLKWLGPASNVVREATVSYPESLLLEGPKFYRSVFQQLWKLKWSPVAKENDATLLAEFWRGVNEGGFSRMEALRAAWTFQQSKPKPEHVPAHLAGLLQTAALPSTGGAVSMDALLLARSAAWLCVAETAATDLPAFDPCWAPTLFLVGRENAAAALWKLKTNETQIAESSGGISQGWNFLLQRPRAKPALVYAAAKQHRAFSMPILAYYSSASGIGYIVGGLMYPIFASDPKTLPHLYDYSPFMSTMGGVSGGRMLEGFWPALARQAWLQALESQPLSKLDYAGHTNALHKARIGVDAALKNPPRDDKDTSLIGLAEASPILTEGYNVMATAPLIPVGTVTSRDLLHYGWESTCVQLETRHRFVYHMWGVPELGQSIIVTATPLVRGFSTMFGGNPGRNLGELASRFKRIEFADASARALGRSPFPIWKTNAVENALTYGRRSWLRPWHIPHQIDALVRVQHLPEIVPFLERLHTEGGPTTDQWALDTLVNEVNYETGIKIPGKMKLQHQLADSLLEPSILQVNTAWDEKYEKMPFFERGQALEKIFWEAPSVRIHEWIYNNYLISHADASARRFYGQVRGMIQEPILFSNGIGLERYVQALLDNDRAAMQQALTDCDSGSYNNMLMLVWDAAYRNDSKAMARQAAEAADRYPSNDGAMDRLKNFIPLLPALSDPKHADRTKALDYFANDSNWAFLQWLLITKNKLGTNDAVRFLGSDNTDLVRQTMIYYVMKDKKRFEESIDKVSRTDAFTNSRFVLLLRLRKELLDVKEPEGQKDLKPANAETIEQAVLASLEKQTR